jgi:hypothetical protein
MLEVLGVKDADKLVPMEDDLKPTDPVAENQALLVGKPTKAFFHQDHDSHIMVHNMMTQDPVMAAQIGQNPQAQMIVAAQQAHIAEHLGFKMRQQIEAQLGMPLPPQDEKLPPQVEMALSGMMAQAAQQMVQQNQALMAQQQAAQQAQDPVVQMQQQELQIKAQEVQLKAQDLELKKMKLLLDTSAKSDRLDLDKEKVSGDLQLESLRVGAQIRESQNKMVADQERAGIQLGVDIAKSKAQMGLQAGTTLLQHAAKNKPQEPNQQ